MADLWPLWLVVFLGLFSPGPNVILLIASGARFGLRETVPHILGVAIGVGILAAAVGLGLGSILTFYPFIRLLFTGLAFAWILYLAWRLWQSSMLQKGGAQAPFTFMQAVMFQVVNPKIWAVAVAALLYVPPSTATAASIILAISFSGINLCVGLFWTTAGQVVSRWLTDPKVWRIFIRTMAILLGLTTPLLFV